LKGQSRGMKGWFFKKVANTQEVTGVFKCIPTIQMPDESQEDLYKEYKNFLVPANLVCRVYVLKWKSLTPKDQKNSDPYLYIKCGNRTINDEKNVIDNTNNPGFYNHFDIAVSIPGASTLKIQVWDDDGVVGDDLIGETKIDLEERWFSKEWRAFNDIPSIKEEEKKEGVELIPKVPIEERTLINKTSAAPQGILEWWIELMSAKDAKLRKPIDIRPFPKKPFEIRIIVWGTKDVPFMDKAEKCNDLYVKGKFGNTELETDTHWRCRENGSFNWRFKFKTEFPFDYDEEYGRNIFTFSLWDRDIIKSNEMIWETRLDLNDYNMLVKAYKRDKAVKMLKLNPKKKKSDRM